MDMTKAELIENIEAIAKVCEKLIAERDEARRELCELIFSEYATSDETPEYYAEERGWDCFKENSK